MEGEPAEDANLFPTTVGEKLRGARLAQGLDLAEIALRTRVPQRHLEAIEASNYAALPSNTYAMGFAKAYARAVGADEVAIARDLRAELNERHETRPIHTPYELDDPTRVPSSGLAWVGAVIAVLVLVGVGLWYGTGLFRGEAPPPESLIVPEANVAVPAAQPAAAPTPVAGGQVTLVARDTVWVRVTDATGNRLFEAEMKPGDRFDVPQTANGPKAKTGRPENLQILVNGSEVAPLGSAGVPVEAEVSAAALQARGTTPTPGATPAAAPGSSAPTTAHTAPRQPQTRPAAPAPTATVPSAFQDTSPAANTTAP